MENKLDFIKSNCKFCSLIKNKKDELVYEDDLFAIFHDIKPKGKIHLLAVPLLHIKNINYLKKENTELLIHMKNKSNELFKEKYNNNELYNIIMGFHIPPYTSVNHLHMHCILPPLDNRKKQKFISEMFFRSVDKQILLLNKE